MQNVNNMQLPDGKIKLIKPSRAYTVNDIINVVVDTYNKSWRQCESIANDFLAQSELETCRKINDYIVDNITYREDGIGYQHVKTPARLIHSGFGDCKSIAILVASLLTCLRIPCKFRFVCISGNEIGHVYVVTDSGINIDPVEVICNHRQFNEVSPYKFKKDMQANGLAVLSGVGSSTSPFPRGVVRLSNTRATNTIFAALDAEYSLLDIEPDNLETLSKIALLLTAFRLYEIGYQNDNLKRAAAVLQYMYEKGVFLQKTVNHDEVMDYVENSLYQQADALFHGDAVFSDAGVWYTWFVENVISENYTNFSEDDEEKINGVFAKAIGATSVNMADLFKQGGGGFLYEQADSNLIDSYKSKFPVIAKKRIAEQAVKSMWKDIFTPFYTRSSIDSFIATGCNTYYNNTANNVVREMVENGNSKIGALSETAILAIIGVITVLIEVGGELLKAYMASESADYAGQLDQTDQLRDTLMRIQNREVAPELTDVNISGGVTTSGGGGGFSASIPTGTIITVGAIIAALAFASSSNNSKKTRNNG